MLKQFNHKTDAQKRFLWCYK